VRQLHRLHHHLLRARHRLTLKERMNRKRRGPVVGAVATILVLLTGNPANAAIPVGQTFTGKAT
jgi:hypothetical protein